MLSFVSDFFHLACFQGSCLLEHILVSCCSFYGYDSTVCKYHVYLSIHQSVDIWVVSTVDCCESCCCEQCSNRICLNTVSVPLDAYVVNCWIKVLSRSLAIWRRAKFFSRMTTLLYIPTSKIGGGFQFLHIPANICHFHWKKCLFYSLFIYLAVLGVSWGMWDLVPWPEVEPRLRALGVWSVSHWPTREVLILIVFLSHP